jgi:hypothetical protein
VGVKPLEEIADLEALWSVEFVSNQPGIGAGVAIFETGRVFGGDSQYYYLGTCEVDGNGVAHADVTATHFWGPMSSIFGPARQVHLRLTGKVAAPVMMLEGSLVEDPSRKVMVRLTRQAELP